MSTDLSELGLTDPDDPGLGNQVTPPRSNRKRRVVVLLADISQSMNTEDAGGRSRITALNERLERWAAEIRAPAAAGTLQDVEFAVVTFGRGGVQVVSRDPAKPDHADGAAFMPAAELRLEPFQAGGVTPMAEAIERGIELAQNRQAYLRDSYNLITGQLRLILFSDGQPTDPQGNPSESWRPIAGRLSAMSAGRQLHFFAFGVPGVNAEVMRRLTPDPRGFRELDSFDFKELLDMILVATLSDDPFDTLHRVYG